LPEDLKIGTSHAGAVATFVGIVRDQNEGRSVNALEYEAHLSLAVREGERILAEAKDLFGLVDARCVHRVGRLEIGEAAIRVEVSAPHRREAFAGCAYVVDEVKARVPIWKKEHYADGDPGWINAGPVNTCPINICLGEAPA
jgi:molybdopterin synthase catalytic subunit